MTKITGKGASFNRWDGSAWVAIANIKSIGGPSATRETVDVTTLDSSGGYREFIGSLRDGGEVALPMLFEQETYAIMKTDFESDTVQEYSIVLPDTNNTTLEFSGIVTGCPLDAPLDDAVACDVTIKISGSTELTSIDNIVSAAAQVDIPFTAVAAKQLAELGLASTIACTLDDATVSNVTVTWNTGTPMYDGTTIGTYVFVGTLHPTTLIRNPDDVSAAVNVVIS